LPGHAAAVPETHVPALQAPAVSKFVSGSQTEEPQSEFCEHPPAPFKVLIFPPRSTASWQPTQVMLAAKKPAIAIALMISSRCLCPDCSFTKCRVERGEQQAAREPPSEFCVAKARLTRLTASKERLDAESLAFFGQLAVGIVAAVLLEIGERRGRIVMKQSASRQLEQLSFGGECGALVRNAGGERFEGFGRMLGRRRRFAVERRLRSPGGFG
jgi:hypothetical protein